MYPYLSPLVMARRYLPGSWRFLLKNTDKKRQNYRLQAGQRSTGSDQFILRRGLTCDLAQLCLYIIIWPRVFIFNTSRSSLHNMGGPMVYFPSGMGSNETEREWILPSSITATHRKRNALPSASVPSCAISVQVIRLSCASERTRLS